MNAAIEFYSYWLTLLASFLVGLVNFKKLCTPLRIICLLMGYNVLAELAAHCLAIRYGNNMPVYHVSLPVIALLTSLYFNYSSAFFRQHGIGWYVGGANVICSVCNSCFIQPPATFNSNALLVFGASAIGLSLLALYRINMESIDRPFTGNTHFWVSLMILFYWSGTVTTWALLSLVPADDIPEVFAIVWCVNIVNCIATGAVFIIGSKTASR